MEVKTKAVVLRSVKYGDNSLIVDMLTESVGRVAFAVRVPKTQKGKLKRQLFQPLTILSIVFRHNQRASLQHLRDVTIAVPYASLNADPAKMCIAMFLAEFLSYATRGEQLNDALFRFVVSGLEWLDGASAGYANFHLVFMLSMTRFIGILPNFDGFRAGSLFDLREGHFTSLVPLHHDFLDSAEAGLLVSLSGVDYGSMASLHLNRTQRNRITDILVTYYRLHVPEMPELRCLSVLKEVLG